MFKVKDGKKIIYFTLQEDADNYNDYLKNGLKVIRVNDKTYHFNNGDYLINVSMRGEEKQRYVLYSGNRRITSEKLQRKHIQVVNK